MRSFYLGLVVICSVSIVACGGGDSNETLAEQENLATVIPNSVDDQKPDVQASNLELVTDINLNSFKRIAFESDEEATKEVDDEESSNIKVEESDTSLAPVPVVKPALGSISITPNYTPGLEYHLKAKCLKSDLTIALSSRKPTDPATTKLGLVSIQCNSQFNEINWLVGLDTPKGEAVIVDLWEMKNNGLLVKIDSRTFK